MRLTAAALLGAPQASRAQAAVYSYPWCAVHGAPGGPTGSHSCYYTSYQRCASLDAASRFAGIRSYGLGVVPARAHSPHRSSNTGAKKERDRQNIDKT
jgi:hypothetical protein